MNEEMVNKIMIKTVSFICDKLTDDELAVLSLVASTDQSPKDRIFDYATVSSLFTEENGAKMHSVTKEALENIVIARLS